VFGSVLGMGLGGAVAAQLGWRYSFFAMAVFGLLVLVAFALLVTEKRIDPERRHAARVAAEKHRFQFRTLMPGLFSARSVIFAYLGNGLQLFIVGSLIAWMPSFLNREYGLPLAKASGLAAGFVLLSGIGMIVCGMFTDRLCRNAPILKFRVAVALSVTTFALLGLGFRLDHGAVQLLVLGLGTFLAAGTTGPSTAMVANVTHPSIHSTAFATLSLANNLLGMAPGPVVTGMLADRYGLGVAFQFVPFICLAAALSFSLGKRHYNADIERIEALA